MSTEPQLIKCRIKKPFGDYEIGDIDHFTPDQVSRWKRKGRISPIVKPKTDLSRVGPAPHDFTDKKGRVAIPNVTARTASGPTERRPEGPQDTDEDKGPDEAPEAAPDKTPEPMLMIVKRHSYGPWYHVYVAGSPVTKKGSKKPRNFYDKDADAYIEGLLENADA